MHRNVFGLLAAILLIAGLVLLKFDGVFGSAGARAAEQPADNAGRAMMRIGIILAALWLVLPDRVDEIRWERVAPRAVAFALVLIVVLTPKLWGRVLLAMLRFWPVVLGLGLLLYLLRPLRRTKRLR